MLHISNTISNVKDFIDIIETVKENNRKNGNNADLLFRGQQADYPLLPKLARLHLKGEISNIENLMLAEFKREMIPLTEFSPSNDWDVLALAQHHGLPTRLLDWTYKALVALLFAVDSPARKDDHGHLHDGVVWILSGHTDDFKLDFRKYYVPQLMDIIKVFRPGAVTRRISSQSGIFTVHNISQDGKIAPFETHIDFRSKLTKVSIPHKEFGSIRKQLNVLGVNYATIYPDIDGLCRHLQWRYSFTPDEMKR